MAVPISQFKPLREVTTAELAQALADRLQAEAASGVIVPSVELEDSDIMLIHIHQDTMKREDKREQIRSQIAKVYETVHPRIDLGMSEVVKNIQEAVNEQKACSLESYSELRAQDFQVDEYRNRRSVSEDVTKVIGEITESFEGSQRDSRIHYLLQAVWRNGFRHGKRCDGSANCGE
jgi:hypothetical protein